MVVNVVAENEKKQKQAAAASCIQSLHHIRLANRRVAALRDHQMSVKLVTLSNTILKEQRRDYFKNEIFHELKTFVLKKHASICVQSIVRGRQARKELQKQSEKCSVCTLM